MPAPEDTFGMTRPVESVPKFEQRKGESEHAFMNRMERETQRVIAKAQYEEKFEVCIIVFFSMDYAVIPCIINLTYFF